MIETPPEHTTPEPIDLKAEREILVKNINNAYANHIGGLPHEIGAIANGLVRLWTIVEDEIRRIDNELTEALMERDKKPCTD